MDLRYAQGAVGKGDALPREMSPSKIESEPIRSRMEQNYENRFTVSRATKQDRMHRRVKAPDAHCAL
jgi:hypothetical protein